jgi:site-specific recombinase XerD
MIDDNELREHRRRLHAVRARRVRPALTLGEQQRLWDACIVWWPTERLVLALLLEMGLRLREVCSLTFDDLQPGALSVGGKDGHVRMMPLGVETQQALDRYLSGAWPRFRLHRDEQAALVNLDAAQLVDLVQSLGQRADLEHPLSVHDLRRAAILHARAAYRAEKTSDDE